MHRDTFLNLPFPLIERWTTSQKDEATYILWNKEDKYAVIYGLVQMSKRHPLSIDLRKNTIRGEEEPSWFRDIKMQNILRVDAGKRRLIEDIFTF